MNQDDTYQIAKVTGPGPLNYTAERWNVFGADLGHMFEHEGRLHIVFGDTFGAPTQAPAPGQILPHGSPTNQTVLHGADHRSGTMAYLQDADPAVGPVFDGMVEDRPGHAAELLSSRKDDQEETVVATSGVSFDGRMFLHYMSIEEWEDGGSWRLNHSGFAYSDDDGRSWTKDPAARWPGDSNFGQVAIVTVGSKAFLFGIPGGRFGGVKLARVEQRRLLEPDAYSYWNGTAWTRDPAEVARIIHSSSPRDTSPSENGLIVPPIVGEFSVRWSPHYRKWLMLHGQEGCCVVLRMADCLAGPWSPPEIVAAGADYGFIYAPYLAPRWNSGPDLYFSLSALVPFQPGAAFPYQVLWMHTSLTGVRPAVQDRCVSPA